MSKPTCTVMVGLPALGKSTLINTMYTPDTWIYSTDMFIDAVAEDNGITYDDAFLSNIKAATEFNERKLETMTQLQKDIIWDQTNLGYKKRVAIVNRMKNKGYQVRCICITPPKTEADIVEWKRRLANREGKTIPHHVLANMMESYLQPSTNEGFDMITFYDMYGALIGIDYGIN